MGNAALSFCWYCPCVRPADSRIKHALICASHEGPSGKCYLTVKRRVRGLSSHAAYVYKRDAMQDGQQLFLVVCFGNPRNAPSAPCSFSAVFLSYLCQPRCVSRVCTVYVLEYFINSTRHEQLLPESHGRILRHDDDSAAAR